MRELPVAISTGSSLDDLRCAYKHTLSLSHTPTQTSKDKDRETESVCALILFGQGSESAPGRVLIGISSSHPTLMFSSVPLPPEL